MGLKEDLVPAEDIGTGGGAFLPKLLGSAREQEAEKERIRKEKAAEKERIRQAKAAIREGK